MLVKCSNAKMYKNLIIKYFMLTTTKTKIRDLLENMAIVRY